MTALFVLDVALVLVFALAWALVLRPPTRPAFIVALFVLVWADLVLVTEVLSLFTLVTAPAMLAGHAVTASAAVLAWRAAGRPRPPRFAPPPRAVWTASLRSSPDVWTLGLAVVLAYGLLAVINAMVPPNNQDSMVYHLARVAFWIQHRTLAPWPTPRLIQVIFPLNAEIGSLWSMVFLRRDVLAGFVQWVSALGGLVSAFGLARLFGYRRAQSAFAGLLCLTLPIIVLQSTTTQNDLSTGAMAAAMFFLLLLGIKTAHRGTLLLSGLAMGLLLGMKYTGFMVLPGLAAGLGVFLLLRKPRPWKPLAFWAASCVAGFIALGAFNYAQNLVTNGHPLGSRTILQYAVHESRPGSLELMRSNMARDLYGFLDFTGVPEPIVRVAAPAWRQAAEKVFPLLGLAEDSPRLTARHHSFAFQTNTTQGNESFAFFGPLGFFLWLPAVAFWLVAGPLKRDARLIPAAVFLGFMAVLGMAQAWQPFRGRFYCTVVILTAPLVAGLCGRGALRTALRVAVMAVSLTVMAMTIATNASKPLVGPNAIWGKTRQELRAYLWDIDRIPHRFIQAWIPAQAKVASVLKPLGQEYFLFGDPLTRTVIPITPLPDTIDEEWFKANRFMYVVVHSLRLVRVENLPPDKFLVKTQLPYKIIIRLK